MTVIIIQAGNQTKAGWSRVPPLLLVLWWYFGERCSIVRDLLYLAAFMLSNAADIPPKWNWNSEST